VRSNAKTFELTPTRSGTICPVGRIKFPLNKWQGAELRLEDVLPYRCVRPDAAHDR
jgi:hypothetical protein